MVGKSSPSSPTESPPPPAIRSLAEYAAVIIGAVLLFLGWYGVSGQSVVAKQLPFLASASIPGVGLIVAGAVLVASDRTRRSNERAADMVGSLYRLLTEAVEDPTRNAGSEPIDPTAPSRPDPTLRPGELVAVAAGARFHRPECALVDGKPDVEQVDAAIIADRGLQPCPICDPAGPAA